MFQPPLRFLLRALVAVTLAAALPSLAAAIMPATLNYEGILYGADGRPLATGRYDFHLSLYADSAGGVPLWTESHAKVQVNSGSFRLVLGKGNPASPLDLPFDVQYYLGVSVDANPELTPRVPLMPTPYSFHSRLSDRVADNAVGTSSLANEAVTDEKIKSVSWSKITGVNGGSGVPSSVWSLKGNANSDPAADFLGTTDAADLVLRTNNQPRFSIRSGGVGEFLSDFYANGTVTSRPGSTSGAFLFGDQSLGIEREFNTSRMRLFGPPTGAFHFDGGNVGIGTASPFEKLEVNGNVGVRSTLKVDGKATLGSAQVDDALDVDGLTHLTNTTASGSSGTGALVVDGGAGIGGSVNVGGAANVTGAATVGGTLGVTGATSLSSTLDVTGATTAGGTLDVTGVTKLLSTTETAGSGSGALVVTGGVGVGKSLKIGQDLTVSGASSFSGPMTSTGGGNFGSLNVSGAGTIGGKLTAGSDLAVTSSASVGGALNVTGATTVAGALSAKKLTAGTDGLLSNGPNQLNGTLTVQSTLNGPKGAESSYPLRVKGASQGILIEVNEGGGGQPTKANQFVSFRDATTHLEHGRISGLTKTENEAEEQYKWEKASLGIQVALAGLDVVTAIGNIAAAISSATACAGLGACVTTPIPSLIVAAIAEGVTVSLGAGQAAGDLTAWLQLQDKVVQNGGVTYSSASADYAEWLPKADPDERIFPGDIVGVRFGHVSKRTSDAEMLMVASTRPLVLGNTPPEGHEAEYVKVAFMGQVPVKVFGSVALGDYLVPSGNDNGYAISRRPADLEATDLSRLVGVAWEATTANGLDYVNTAVGLDRAGVAQVATRQDARLREQADEIAELRRQIRDTNRALARLVPGFDDSMNGTEQATHAPMVPVPAPAPAPLPVDALPGMATATVTAPTGPLVSRHDVELGIRQAIENLRRSGATPENNPILRQLLDPKTVDEVRTSLEAGLNGQFARAR